VLPQCSVVSNEAPTAIPLSRIIDESHLVRIAEKILRLDAEIRSTHKRKGMTPVEAREFVQHLTRSIGFVEILGVRIAREAEQLIQATQEQCEALADLEINPRIIVHGAAGTGKTVLAQELAKKLEARGQSVLFLFYNKALQAKSDPLSTKTRPFSSVPFRALRNAW